MKSLGRLNVKIFADGADIATMKEMYGNPLIAGFTTNPTLIRRVGVSNYRAFAQEVLTAIPNRPISFEVIADEFDEMEIQARKIASWGSNINVKIPITNTRGESTTPLIARLSRLGIEVNVTAITLIEQVQDVLKHIDPKTPAKISVFAGRIADTGLDPVPLMEEVVKILRGRQNVELIWASPRELLNIFQANAIGCHIITATNDILKKLPLVGKDLKAYSLETVQMFHADALAAGFSID
jgi:transaldolase